MCVDGWDQIVDRRRCALGDLRRSQYLCQHAAVVGRCDTQQRACGAWQLGGAGGEGVFNMRRHRQVRRQHRFPVADARVKGQGQLQQREWVALCLGKKALAYRRR